jgi:hypothetical protein
MKRKGNYGKNSKKQAKEWKKGKKMKNSFKITATNKVI